MSQYYLSAELSRYVDEHGGRDFLADLVKRDMDPLSKTRIDDIPCVPVTVRCFCEHCGVRLQVPGADVCFHCGRRQA